MRAASQHDVRIEILAAVDAGRASWQALVKHKETLHE